MAASLAGIGALVLVALATSGEPPRGGPSAAAPLEPFWQPDPDPGLAAPLPGAMPVNGWICPQCAQQVAPTARLCPRCGWQQGQAPGLQQVALGRAAPLAPGATAPGDAAGAGPADALPSPREQNAAKKQFIEAHWLGLEAIPLTAELAKEYGIAPSDRGVLVDEITLEAAESGVLAGDLVRAVDGHPTPTLEAFFQATQRVRRSEQASIEVSRRGKIRTFSLRARNTDELGFAQMEAAQPIQPGAISPHRSRSKPCTSCHVIMMQGGQLPTDSGDVLPTPPPIPQGATPPHGDRGACNTCHAIQ